MGIRKPHFYVRFTNQVKLDLEVWLKFLQDFNGKSFFLDEKFLTGDYHQLYTDAAGGIGYGALWPFDLHGNPLFVFLSFSSKIHKITLFMPKPTFLGSFNPCFPFSVSLHKGRIKIQNSRHKNGIHKYLSVSPPPVFLMTYDKLTKNLYW